MVMVLVLTSEHLTRDTRYFSLKSLDLLQVVSWTTRHRDEPVPTLTGGRTAIGHLKNRRAAGPDEISPELMKHCSPALEKEFHLLASRVWETENAPQDRKDAIIVTLYKNMDPTLCDNYRGLSLLSVPGKVCSILLLYPLQDRLEKVMMESQSGFRRGSSTTYHLFTLQQVLHDSWMLHRPTQNLRHSQPPAL